MLFLCFLLAVAVKNSHILSCRLSVWLPARLDYLIQGSEKQKNRFLLSPRELSVDSPGGILGLIGTTGSTMTLSRAESHDSRRRTFRKAGGPNVRDLSAEGRRQLPGNRSKTYYTALLFFYCLSKMRYCLFYCLLLIHFITANHKPNLCTNKNKH